MTRYQYCRPESLEEALELVSTIEGARIIAGGTDLLVQVRKQRTPKPLTLISLRGVKELERIESGAVLRIGAMAPLAAIESHSEVIANFPSLVRSIGVLGSRQIRNVATMGGNLCNASPAADTATPLLVHLARVELRGVEGTRELPLDEFILGPGMTALRSGEVLSRILLDLPGPDLRTAFLRKGRVKMDLAIASVAVAVEIEARRCRVARVAAGAVAPIPKRLPGVEQLLVGSELDDETLARVRKEAGAEVAPIDDLRSSADYRRRLVGVFVERALRSCSTSLQEALS